MAQVPRHFIHGTSIARLIGDCTLRPRAPGDMPNGDVPDRCAACCCRQENAMPGHNIIPVGGSAGALGALRDLVAALPADLPAALFITTHLTPYAPSYLPEILSRAARLPVRHPEDREPFRAG